MTLLAVAAGALLACASAALTGLTAARDFLCNLVTEPFKLVNPRAGELVQAQAPSMLLVVAKSFLARWQQRSQPLIQPNFRLCSSA